MQDLFKQGACRRGTLASSCLPLFVSGHSRRVSLADPRHGPPAGRPARRVSRTCPTSPAASSGNGSTSTCPPPCPAARRARWWFGSTAAVGRTGSRAGLPGQGRLVARGYVVASIGYRLSQEAIFPAQIEDVKAAVRWLRAHAGEYGIDPRHVARGGRRIGGRAPRGPARHDGTRPPRFDVGENLDQSSAVQCVDGLVRPVGFPALGRSARGPGDVSTRRTPRWRICSGGRLSPHLDAASARPVRWTFVDKDSAPFLIMHGDKDSTRALAAESGTGRGAAQGRAWKARWSWCRARATADRRLVRRRTSRGSGDFLARHLGPEGPRRSHFPLAR